jgi:hypothetical protein
MATVRRLNGKTGLRRESRAKFISDLPELHDHSFPERPPIAIVNMQGHGNWKGYRLRGEIAAVVDALTERAEKATGVRYSSSEVFAAIIIAALPQLLDTQGSDFRRRGI